MGVLFLSSLVTGVFGREAQPVCEGYVFHLDQCYLKKDLGAMTVQQDAVTHVKASSNCAGYTPEIKDIDMSGTLVAKIRASDAKRCCALCDSTLACEGYVFHLDQCYLKRNFSFFFSPNAGAITRLRFGEM